MTKANKGTHLEARIQRLVLAQGIFAERGLVPAASQDHRLLATDIDVLASEYHPSFHLTRSHYECKSGKVQPLDRVLWLSGVRALLNADASFLVVPQVDLEVMSFARAQKIDILTSSELDELESNLGVDTNVWPGRSDFLLFDQMKSVWRKKYGDKNPSQEWKVLKSILAFVEIDSWLGFDFRRLNILFRLLSSACVYLKGERDPLLHQCATYALNSLTVRFCQYLLYLCGDLRGIGKSERKQLLERKLTFGETNPEQARGLIEGTLRLVREAGKGSSDKSTMSVDVARLTAQPAYTSDFIALVDRAISAPQEARYLAVSMEVNLFDCNQAVQKFSALAEASSRGEPLAVLVNGFVQRLVSLPSVPRISEELSPPNGGG